MSRFDDERLLFSRGECKDWGDSLPPRKLVVDVLRPSTGVAERRSMLRELAERLRLGLRGGLPVYAGDDGGKGARVGVSAMASLDIVSGKCCDPCLTSVSLAEGCLSIVQCLGSEGLCLQLKAVRLLLSVATN